MVRKGHPHPQKGQLRPHVWKAGPDPVRHKKYLVWLQQRNQAIYREEPWTIGFDDWIQIWGDKWEHRGRQRGQYCMSRKDWSLPWSVDNVAIITREQHARMQGDAVKAGWRSPAQKKARLKRGLPA